MREPMLSVGLPGTISTESAYSSGLSAWIMLLFIICKAVMPENSIVLGAMQTRDKKTVPDQERLKSKYKTSHQLDID